MTLRRAMLVAIAGSAIAGAAFAPGVATAATFVEPPSTLKCYAPHDNEPPATDTLRTGPLRFGYTREVGGIGVDFILNGVDVLDGRYAGGAGLQTSVGAWEHTGSWWFFNQGAGNLDPQYHWHIPASSSTYIPLYSDHVWPWPNPDMTYRTTTPCGRTSEAHEDMRVRYTADESVLTSQLTLRSRVSQSWQRWFAEGAFYLRRDVALRQGLTLHLTTDDGKIYLVNPTQPTTLPIGTFDGRAWLFGRELKRAVFSWAGLGSVRMEADLGGWLSWSPYDCPGETYYCAIEWHTYLSYGDNVRFSAGQTRTYTMRYRVSR